jgi:NADH-quinone oxidoreductase subunit J
MNVLVVVAMALAAISSLGVVLSRQTLYSALSLVVTIAMISVLFLLLNAQFLFAVQLIIYAGAVMVLFVFIIALLSPDAEDRPALDWRAITGLAAVGAVTILVFVAASNGTTYNSGGFRAVRLAGSCATQHLGSCDPYRTFAFPVDAVNAAGNVQTVAGQLFTTFLLPFEITSLLLLVAVIGAVYLTRRAASQEARSRVAAQALALREQERGVARRLDDAGG